MSQSYPQNRVDNCTGARPTRLSADGKIIEISLDFPTEWADLYETWNMAFVTNYNSWPFFLVKLLVPSVSGYHAQPSTFLFMRALALYVHINRGMMGNIYPEDRGKRPNWRINRELSKVWGEYNLKASKNYSYLRKRCSS